MPKNIKWRESYGGRRRYSPPPRSRSSSPRRRTVSNNKNISSPTTQNVWHGKECSNHSDCGQDMRCHSFDQYNSSTKRCICNHSHIFVQDSTGGACRSLRK